MFNKLREILAMPFGLVIAAFYALTGNFLFSLLCLTLIVKLILLPSQISQQKAQAKQARLQPKIRRIKEKYANNQKKIQEETQALYSREGYGAATAGCAPMLIQLPIMMGVYWAVNYTPLSNVLRIPSAIVTALKTAVTPFVTSNGAYATVQGELNVLKNFSQILASGNIEGLTTEYITKINIFIEKFTFLGMQMTETPNFKEFNKLWIVPILLVLTSFIQSGYMFLKQKKNNPEMASNPAMGCTTLLMSPAMMLWFSFILPISVGVYMILSNILALIQMAILSYTHSPQKVLSKLMIEETIYRRSKEVNTRKVLEMKN